MARDNVEARLQSARRTSELSTKLADDAVKQNEHGGVGPDRKGYQLGKSVHTRIGSRRREAQRIAATVICSETPFAELSRGSEHYMACDGIAANIAKLPELRSLTVLGEGRNPKAPAVKRVKEDWSGSRY